MALQLPWRVLTRANHLTAHVSCVNVTGSVVCVNWPGIGDPHRLRNEA
jgi:hypothetical protein